MRDVSLSGLSIQTTSEPSQGDAVEVVIDGGVVVQAIAWRVRRTATGHLVGLMLSDVGSGYEGLVARAGGDARRAVPRAAAASAAVGADAGARDAAVPEPPKSAAATPPQDGDAPKPPPVAAAMPTAPPVPAAPPSSPPTSAARAADAKSAAPPALPWWSLRVRATGGSRTRSIKLAAADRDEAVAHALAEMGPGWTILGVEEARPSA